MNDEFSREEGNALWRQAVAAARPSPSPLPVSALDLAAWLDGRAKEDLAGRVEAALASDPTLLDTALAALAATSEIDDQASERLTVRARALVAPEIKQATRSGGWLAGIGRWRRSAEWAAIGQPVLVRRR